MTQMRRLVLIEGYMYYRYAVSVQVLKTIKLTKAKGNNRTIECPCWETRSLCWGNNAPVIETNIAESNRSFSSTILVLELYAMLYVWV